MPDLLARKGWGNVKKSLMTLNLTLNPKRRAALLNNRVLLRIFVGRR
jgi:hypothetical protein